MSLNIEQFPSNIKTYLKLAQSFENTDPVIAFHFCVKAKTLIEEQYQGEDKELKSSQIDLLTNVIENKPQFIQFKESTKSPAEYLLRKAVMLLQNSDKQLKEKGPSLQIGKTFLVSSYLFDLYELFFPLNDTSKKMQTYAKIKANECTKLKESFSSPMIEEPVSIPDDNKTIHYITEEKPIDQPASTPLINQQNLSQSSQQPIKSFEDKKSDYSQSPLQNHVISSNPQIDISRLSLLEKQNLAEKYIQSAISSLDFQDPKTSAQYLHAALELLN
ncbi:hypothetical protein ENUP19_0009G0042 [Entamoeba nuttalli]|uniref:Vta1/callose synthase N-terminal domain-containing protein n=2 Tax=Entamoeba nuttalli TaxID=412467 RepID=K2GST0_ENTNP|nr:hypothetical protein ENU1_214910 [Entamoeba nuttalli P19]EKE36902.1 hypothetical protein ENU1_214910 [Entamoeba nuttalli P19]|eukprot:XP_008860767.1 hypothetical protein ENU1_214910 [Entamoeba nuttalli P19]